MLTTEQKKSVFRDTYDFFDYCMNLTATGKPSMEDIRTMSMKLSEINKRHSYTPLCGAFLVAILRELERVVQDMDTQNKEGD